MEDNRFNGLVKLSEEQYKTLQEDGSIVINGKTIVYDPLGTLYLTPKISSGSDDEHLPITGGTLTGDLQVGTDINNHTEVTPTRIAVRATQEIDDDENPIIQQEYEGALDAFGFSFGPAGRVPTSYRENGIRTSDSGNGANWIAFPQDKSGTFALLEDLGDDSNLDEYGNLKIKGDFYGQNDRRVAFADEVSGEHAPVDVMLYSISNSREDYSVRLNMKVKDPHRVLREGDILEMCNIRLWTNGDNRRKYKIRKLKDWVLTQDDINWVYEDGTLVWKLSLSDRSNRMFKNDSATQRTPYCIRIFRIVRRDYSIKEQPPRIILSNQYKAQWSSAKDPITQKRTLYLR